MNETNSAITNGATNGSHSTTPAEPSLVDAAGLNGQPSPVSVEPSLTSANAADPKEPSTPPVEKILDESLDEQDIKIAISVSVNGRKIDIMKRGFEKTFFDAMESSNRGVLFNSIKQFLDQEIYQAIAVKLNRKVPVTVTERAGLSEQQKGKSRQRSEPIPPFKAFEDEEDLSLHITPTDCRE